jgi:hypothetical protein
MSPQRHPLAGQRRCVGTRGGVVGWKWLARQWHARGQGFKSPQLHPSSEALSASTGPESPASRSRYAATAVARPIQVSPTGRRIVQHDGGASGVFHRTWAHQAASGGPRPCDE